MIAEATAPFVPTVRTERSNEACIEVVRHGLSTLTAGETAFARSLVGQYQSKGRLSDKQWPYVRKFAERIAPVNPVAPIPATSPEAPAVGTYTPIIALFDKAHDRGLQYPRLFIGDFRLSRTGSTSRAPGSVAVKSGEVFIGYVKREGTTTIPAEHPARAVIDDLAANGGEFLTLSGRKSGVCCCCGRELTDSESVANGIGPVCASKWC